MAKIYPEENFANRVGVIQSNNVAENFFIVPGKHIHPLPEWKKQELAKDPSFKDLQESLKEQGGLRDTWSSKHGYDTTIREEAAVLKKNTREARLREESTQQKIQTIQTASVNDCGCVIM